MKKHTTPKVTRISQSRRVADKAAKNYVPSAPKGLTNRPDIGVKPAPLIPKGVKR